MHSHPIQQISVIVPKNPFVPKEFENKEVCLCALNVEDLIRWWPGKPHEPVKYANKVKAIQRSLDWKRVAQIAAYLLQEEIEDVPDKLNKYFNKIYEPTKYEPGREWPPKVSKVIGYAKSEYRVFSNILVHINGAKIVKKKIDGEEGAGELIFDEDDPNLIFSVIDGQHRINGAYFAVKILQERDKKAKLELPVEAFLELDSPSQSRVQAQIFIDVNFYQKKVDGSLVADLFPTARGPRGPLDNQERAQDIGRKLMLETGPLVGMIQIPGIKFGFKDVITLATLNSAIEDVIDTLHSNGLESLSSQTNFLSQCLTAWLQASGRFEKSEFLEKKELTDSNVALIPALIWKLRKRKAVLISENATVILTEFLKSVAQNAGLLDDDVFIDRNKFKSRGFLGSGGIARFRDLLWASIKGRKTGRLKLERISKIAEENRAIINKYLSKKQLVK
jgi:DGQHR domain-containing protein